MYPRLGTGQVMYRRQFSESMWVGPASRLISIQNTLQDALEQAYNVQVDALRADRELSSSRYKLDLDRLTNDLRLDVTVSGDRDNWKHEGDVGPILASVETVEVEKVKMNNSLLSDMHGRVSVSVHWKRSSVSQAVEVRVSGPDAMWVDGLTARLRKELSRNRPWWRWLHSMWVVAAGTILTSATVFSVLDAVIPPHSEILGTVGVFVTLGFFAGTPFFLMWLLPKIFPSFEVYTDGDASTSGKRVSAGVGLCAFLVSTFVVPIVMAVVAN